MCGACPFVSHPHGIYKTVYSLSCCTHLAQVQVWLSVASSVLRFASQHSYLIVAEGDLKTLMSRQFRVGWIEPLGLTSWKWPVELVRIVSGGAGQNSQWSG